MRKAPGAMILFAATALLVAVSGRAQDASGSGPSSVEVSDEGKQIYEQICQACHLADAKGGGGAGAVIPALAGNQNLADPDYMIDVLMHGRGGMPWFNDILTSAQIAAVTNYVRTHFNDFPGMVTETDVEALAVASGKPDVAECTTCE